MSEPRRWLEGAGPVGAGALLRAGLAEVPSRKSLRRTLLAVSATTVAATTAGGALGAAAAQSAGMSAFVFVAKCAAIGVVSAGVIVSAAVGVRQVRLSSVAPHMSAVAVASKPQRQDRQNAPVPVAELPAAAPVSSEELPRTGATIPTPPPSVVPARLPEVGDRVVRPPAVPADSALPSDNAQRHALNEELLFIDAARLRLRSGDAVGAIERVREYEQRADFGHFLPEALYLRMQAELQLGNRAAAKATAHEIISRFPRAAQIRRASEVLKTLDEVKEP